MLRLPRVASDRMVATMKAAQRDVEPRLICVCSSCGREADMVPIVRPRWLEPPGWVAFNVIRWPTVEMYKAIGSVRLRFCATCVAMAQAETAEVLEQVAFTAKGGP